MPTLEDVMSIIENNSYYPDKEKDEGEIIIYDLDALRAELFNLFHPE